MQPVKRLAQYEIVSAIGKGGMGEVYRAHDTKLGREVAIKVLPSEFAQDPERLARLEREARMLAALNHPNIAAIYGLEQSDDTRFLVLELVEGDTLAERIRRGAIPVEESLDLAVQIAGALEAAHRKGVVHRDLKPANIKITPEGTAKVLDFGLAKAMGGERADVDLANSPTLSQTATQEGVILGTAAYMSPEQAKGLETDKRADVWAFGCVLYEMLTGRPVFAGEDVTTILARVVDREPDFDALPGDLHPKLIDVLARCLQKDASRRYQDIGDARLDIESVRADPSGVFVPAAGETAKRPTPGWVAAALGILLLAGAAVWMLRPPEAEAPEVFFTHVLPPGEGFAAASPLGGAGTGQFDVSPDGSEIVYAAGGQLHRRPLDARETQPVPGTEEDPHLPVFSPDGEWIAYWSRTEEALRKIPLAGGTPQTIAGVPSLPFVGSPLGIGWDVDDRLLYATPEGIWEVSPAGGQEPVLRLSQSEGLMVFPQLLPEQNAILYTDVVLQSAQQSVVVRALEDGAESESILEGAFARYLDTGHLVFRREGALYGIGFDPETLEVQGDPRRLVDGLGGFAASADAAILAYTPAAEDRPGPAAERRTLAWVDGEGREEAIPVEPGEWRRVRVSPDGSRLLLYDENGLVYTWAFDTGTLSAVGTSPLVPVWLDGEEIMFSGPEGISSRGFESSAVEMVADPETFPRTLFRISSYHAAGRALVVTLMSGEASEIGLLRLDGNPGYEVVIERPDVFSVSDAHLSPDGTHIVLVEATPTEIVVRRFPDVETERVSLGPGLRPVWTPSGIYFLQDSTIWRVPVETEPRLRVGEREAVVRTQGYFVEFAAGERNWDFAPDGRLVMIKQGEDPPGAQLEPDPGPPRIHVIVNWHRQLLEQVPLD